MFRLLFLTVFCFALSGITLWWAFSDPSTDNAEFHNQTEAQKVALITEQADLGDREAQFRLGEYLRDGVWLAADKRKAFEMFFKSAKQSYPPAMIAVGRAYENGEGVKRSFSKAAEWYLLAGRSFGSSEGQFLLGQMYLYGRGVPHDYAQAFRWTSMAAKNNHPGAQFLMGAMYESGWGVELDLVQAYLWYSKALPSSELVTAINPRFKPSEALERLTKNMRDHELQKAKAVVAKSGL